MALTLRFPSLFTALFVILAFNFVANINAEPLKPKRSEFGEQCNSTIKCSKSSWLTCQKNGICGCSLHDEMIFESNKNKCVSKASERCKFEIESDSAFKLIEKAECVENSICSDEDGICICNSGYFETVNGTCLPKGNLGNSCSINEECKDNQFLICLNNSTCGCENNTSEFSTEYQHCVGLAGQKCIQGKCTSDAVCNHLGICSCDTSDEYYEDDFGHCQLKKNFGDRCSNNTFECKDTSMLLSCINGTCECDRQNSYQILTSYYGQIENPNYDYEACRSGHFNSGSYYCRRFIEDDIYTFECAGLADKPCSKNGRCVENAQCNNENICKCFNYGRGYSSTSIGMCARGYKESCSNSTLCSDKFTCTESTCTCKLTKHQEYFSNEDKCLSIVSGPCSSDEDCINDAFCDRSVNAKNGLCQCKSGFIENKIGKCDLAHGARCDYDYSDSPLCDQSAELQCRNEICSCKDELFKYDKELTLCVGIVDSRCSIVDANTGRTNCVKNASCVGVRQVLETGRCKCDWGFIATEEGECTSTRNATSYLKLRKVQAVNNKQIDEPVLIEDKVEEQDKISEDV